MERIRRTKRCRYLRKKRQNEHLKRERETFNIQGEDNTLTSHNVVCHPYEDKINLVHALADVLSSADSFLDVVQYEWTSCVQYGIHNETFDVLNMRYLKSFNITCYLLSEALDADKNRVPQYIARGYRTVFSRMEGYQNRKVPPCGNYIKHAQHLVNMAELGIARSQNKQERLIHLKKLKFFKALTQMLEIKTLY